MSTEVPSLGEVIRQNIAAALGRVHTSFPARVIKYDPATQKATVQSVVRFRRIDSEGNIETYLPPPIPNVPVLFFSTGSHAITFPIPNDTQGLVVCAERSVDEWKSRGSTDVEPSDPRRFDLADAFFLPAGRAFVDAIPASGIDPSDLVLEGTISLGSSSASDLVVLTSKLKTYLSSVESWLAGHIHVDPISGTTGQPSVPPTFDIGATDISASKVKAE